MHLDSQSRVLIILDQVPWQRLWFGPEAALGMGSQVVGFDVRVIQDIAQVLARLVRDAVKDDPRIDGLFSLGNDDGNLGGLG